MSSGRGFDPIGISPGTQIKCFLRVEGVLVRITRSGLGCLFEGNACVGGIEFSRGSFDVPRPSPRSHPLSASHRILNRTFLVVLWIVPGAAILAFLIFVTPLVPVECAVYAAGPRAPVFHLAVTNDGTRYKDLQQPLQISPTKSLSWWERGGSDFGEPFYEFKGRTVTHLISPGDWFTIFRRR